ncbi:MAG TPA: hypothetical protein VF930_02360 [Stellaceae bacterium]
MPKPASVTSKLKLSNSALKMREVRDGFREKIRDVEDKSLRRAIIAPQEPTSPMRVLTSAKP